MASRDPETVLDALTTVIEAAIVAARGKPEEVQRHICSIAGELTCQRNRIREAVERSKEKTRV